MKFEGTASIIVKRFADSVSLDTPELRGLRYQASRLQAANADDLFDLRFENGEWMLEYLRDLDQDDAKAASALVRYAEARLAALEEKIYKFATGAYYRLAGRGLAGRGAGLHQGANSRRQR